MPGGRPKGDYTQALRLLSIVEMLQHRAQITIRDLMSEFDVDRRTVQRDIAVLQQLYAIEEGERVDGNLKTFRLKSGARLDTLKLTLLEMIALYMGRNLFAFTAGTELKGAMDSLYDKLQTRLCARNATVRASLPKKFYTTTGFPKSYRAADDVLDAILKGLIDERKVEISYAIPGRRPYTDIIHPWTLVLHNHALYVVCYSERAGERRMLAIERIRSSEWRNQGPFDYPTRYEPARELGTAFGIISGKKATRVRLLFNPELAPYIAARQWHRSMRSKVRKDGGLEVTLDVSLGEEVLHWLTGYGGAVRILSPKALRDTVNDRHRAALRTTRSPSRRGPVN